MLPVRFDLEQTDGLFFAFARLDQCREFQQPGLRCSLSSRLGMRTPENGSARQSICPRLPFANAHKMAKPTFTRRRNNVRKGREAVTRFVPQTVRFRRRFSRCVQLAAASCRKLAAAPPNPTPPSASRRGPRGSPGRPCRRCGGAATRRQSAGSRGCGCGRRPGRRRAR